MIALRRASIHVRNESVPAVNLERPARLLYASDLHLGLPWTNRAADELLGIALRVRPDAILLGGDLAENAAGIDTLVACAGKLRDIAPVLAVPGNHDHRVGLERIERALTRCGVNWLTSVTLPGLRLESQLRSSSPGDNIARILVTHNPSEFDRAAELGYRLVFAGHLHGGQCVLFTRAGRQYPGALFARYTGLRFSRGPTTMLVSRGAADTLPLRWNCPREVILCTVS